MEKKMTKRQAAGIAAKLLLKIYGDDMNASANIINAEAMVIEGKKEGVKTLTEALESAKYFMQELINRLNYDTKPKPKEKHTPRGC